jgi:hypothetical protein
MSDPLLADPASCSQAGGALRRLAAELRATNRPVHEALATDPGPRPSRVEVLARRRLDTVDDAVAATTVVLDRVGTALQAHATELAHAVAARRQLTARAQAVGLDVVDGAVVPAWGVTGVADRAAVSARDATAAALQTELDGLRGAVAARGEQLAAVAADARHVLATHTTALRR